MFNKSFLALSLGTALLSACGGLPEESSSLNEFRGLDFVVTTKETNLRDENLQVFKTVPADVIFQPTGRSKQGVVGGKTFTFYEVEHFLIDGPNTLWIADGDRVTTTPPAIDCNNYYLDIQGYNWFVITREDNGGLNCRERPGTDSRIVKVLKYGSRLTGIVRTSNPDGKPWLKVTYDETYTECYVRATRSRIAWYGGGPGA